tara:strand:- start:1299 stop:1655 length:357 start_codon:yes stop_codon:yes gene_type:complete
MNKIEINKIEINNNTSNSKKYIRSSVIIQNYIWYWPCSICGNNAVGREKCSNFYFAITSPTYFDENENIKKIGLCELCVNEYKLDSFNKKHILIDTDKKEYELKGLENGQYSENLNYD